MTTSSSASKPTTTTSSLGQLLKDFNIQLPTPTTPTAKTKKPLKSGTYESVSYSSRVPDTTSLTQTINSVFKDYYGRDASQSELQNWLPLLEKQYKNKNGQSQTTTKSTYKNGQLIKTEYLTAEGSDPKVWLDNQLKSKVLAGDVGVNKLNVPEGPAGQYFTAVKKLAANNGLNISDMAAAEYATKIVAGTLDANTAYNTIRESAANAFPALADKIKQGIDVKTLADPYIQSMSNILEIPDTGIDLFDPKIRSAMAFTLPDGKVGTKSIYDFEKELRQDPRWQYTNNARQQAASVATTVLKDFGFMG